MTLMRSGTMLAGISLVVCAISSAELRRHEQISPADLVKAVIRNELQAAENSDNQWKYRLDKEVDGNREVREVVETKAGSLDRVVMRADRPLTDSQAHDETARILKLSHNPEEQRKLEQSKRKDADQGIKFLRMIPEAFVFEPAGESGHLVKVLFKPNPQFRPSSREGMVFHEMAGEIWVDARQQRLVSIRGQLMNEVKFGGGLLGHLEKGGQFTVKRAEIAPGAWEVTEIAVNMRGKALLFKSIAVQQKEFHSNFQAVPDDLSLADAAALLLRQDLVAARR